MGAEAVDTVETVTRDFATATHTRQLRSNRVSRVNKVQAAPELKKGKVFPYSLPSVGPGADPGVQAVSPQVT